MSHEVILTVVPLLQRRASTRLDVEYIRHAACVFSDHPMTCVLGLLLAHSHVGIGREEVMTESRHSLLLTVGICRVECVCRRGYAAPLVVV